MAACLVEARFWNGLEPMRINLLLVISTSLLASRAVASPPPIFDARKLFTESTHIAVIQLASDEDIATANSDVPGTKLTVSVQRRIRGSDLPGTFTLWITESYLPFSGGSPFHQSDAFVAFLVRAPRNGDWQLTEPYYGLFRVSPVRQQDGLCGQQFA
jgi:hypothetical protein